MGKIRGTNLGNWLVLEKWMEPEMFSGTNTEDETWLSRTLGQEKLQERMETHRDTYVTEEDFKIIKSHGMNTVRIPVPYFIFGDRPPFIGCIEYLDKAFDWAEKYGLKILIDMHTTPGSQNGYDNGGICGVCNWRKKPEEVEFVTRVLEKLAERYAHRKGLFGIEVVNEPISFSVYMTSPTHNKYVDKKEAEGSSFVPMSFLKKFYTDAYRRLRKILPEDKVIVFHDGFRLMRWGDFFEKSGMKNVMLDTHIYIFAMENFVPVHKEWVYKMYIGFNRWMLKKVEKHIPVIVGEWCICNKEAEHLKKKGAPDSEVVRAYRRVAELQLDVWEEGAGYFYWNYQLSRDKDKPLDEEWKNAWDLSRCWKNGWMPERLDRRSGRK